MIRVLAVSPNNHQVYSNPMIVLHGIKYFEDMQYDQTNTRWGSLLVRYISIYHENKTVQKN